MRAARGDGRLRRIAVLLCSVALVACGSQGRGVMVDANGQSVPVPDKLPEHAGGRELYESYCSPCHSLEMVTNQRLDRPNWEWVMEDMVGKYGATWITPGEQERIIDYLVENHGIE